MGLLTRAIIVSFSLLYFSLSLTTLNELATTGAISGYVVHPVYNQFAEPLGEYSISSRSFGFGSSDDAKTLSVSGNDFAVYRYAYISFDGGSWQRIDLSGNTLGGDWLNGSVSADVTVHASDFGLSQDRPSTQRNFVVLYSCSRASGSWDCHSGWQIWQFNASVAAELGGLGLPVASVTASGQVEDHAPENTLDGVIAYESIWSGEGSGSWIEYELTEATTVGAVNISFWRGEYRVAYFSIATSTDGSTWNTVYDGQSSGKTVEFETFDFPDTTAKYVKITGYGNEENDFVSFAEVAILGAYTSPVDEPYCSDGDCNGDEDCSTCPADCGCPGGYECQSGTCIETHDTTDPFDIRGNIMQAVGLVHDQEFLIPENSVNGDTAGQLNRIWLDYFGQDVTYAIVGGNDNGVFSIDYKGVISVSNAAQLDYSSKPEYHVVVRATETTTHEASDATITVKLTDCTTPGMTVFINPDCQQDEGCCGEGTRSCPFGLWTDALGSWGQNYHEPGQAYLQKRGTVASQHIHTLRPGYPDGHIKFGAYGSGARPVLDGSYTTDMTVGIYIGNFANPIWYVDVYSFEVRDFSSNGMVKTPDGHNVTITDCYIHDNGVRTDVDYDKDDDGKRDDPTPGIFIWEMRGDRLLPTDCAVRDTVMIGNHEHGVKTEGGGVSVDFSYASDNGGNGFSCPAAANVNYTNSIAMRNDGSGFKLQCNNMHVENDVSEYNFQDGYMNGNYYVTTIGDGRFGFNLSARNILAAHNIGEGFIFQDNVEGSTLDGLEAYNNSHGIWARHETNNNTIKNSKIYDNFISGIFFSNYMNSQGTRDTHDYDVINNLIYNNGFVDDRYPRIVSGDVMYKDYSGNSWCTIYFDGHYTHSGGYYFHDEPTGIEIEDAHDIRITGNRIYDDFSQGSFVPVRTTSQSYDIFQSGNTLE